MEDLWAVREYTGGDEKGILDLRKAAFGDVEPEKQDMRFWEWEFMKGYAGASYIYVAYLKKDNTIIGHNAYNPANFISSDQMLRAVLSCDSMTRPKHRYPWMFMSVMEFAEEDLKRQGVDFIFGFAYREGMTDIAKALGYKTLFKVPVIVMPMNFSRLCRHYLRSKIISSVAGAMVKICYKLRYIFSKPAPFPQINVEKTDFFDDSFNDLWERVKGQFKIIQQRDSSSLNWRFASNPLLSYTIFKASVKERNVGYAVLRETELFGLKCAIICDMAVDNIDENVLKALIYEIAKYYTGRCALIGTIITNGNKYFNAFRKMGFMNSGMGFELNMKLLSSAFDVASLKESDFFLTWFDSDTM